MRTEHRTLVRLARMLALVALAVPLLAGPAAARTSSASGSTALAADVEALRQAVDRAADRLTEGTAAYEEAVARFEAVTQEQWSAERTLQIVQQDGARARSRVDAIARAAYKGGLPAGLSAVLSADPRALSDLAHLRASLGSAAASGASALEQLDEERARGDELVAERDRLRREALARKKALDAQLAALRAEARTVTAELERTADRLRRAQAREAREAASAAERAAAARRAAALGAATGATGGTPGCGGVREGAVNGYLGDSDLCGVRTVPGHRLRTDAARAFDSLNELRIAQTGKPLCITDSYRSYPEQVDVFRRKPALAAVPGRSNHGWGLALDLGCGAQNFGSEVDDWLLANAPTYGWRRPAWAQPGGSKPEPWHWEYGPA